MPITITEGTVDLNTSQMAEILGVTAGYVSHAANHDYKAGGVRVSQYKKMHWKGNRISHYEVPVEFITERVPQSEWLDYGVDWSI